MKRYLLAMAGSALIATTFSSCSWFNRKKEAHADIAGTWRLDSTFSAKDGNANDLPVILAALAAGDSAQVTYTFTGDSLQASSGGEVIESVAYRYEKPVVVLLDSSGERFHVQRGSDSSLVLQARDSTRMYLTRQ